ncbi:hypothetical protein QQ008_20865 [Fulvivirgaceae bacterium BMA10]|uniref:Uncharacterized protein n=1 Tax=Splendidivirga corallicola TaxID=3051826 RepID=A0ABT8KSW6_9BACT|nr:hypothetical protein [Fulvivirgaceae bacterium BMA10]
MKNNQTSSLTFFALCSMISFATFAQPNNQSISNLGTDGIESFTGRPMKINSIDGYLSFFIKNDQKTMFFDIDGSSGVTINRTLDLFEYEIGDDDGDKFSRFENEYNQITVTYKKIGERFEPTSLVFRLDRNEEKTIVTLRKTGI